jgi:hypothetical protein
LNNNCWFIILMADHDLQQWTKSHYNSSFFNIIERFWFKFGILEIINLFFIYSWVNIRHSHKCHHSLEKGGMQAGIKISCYFFLCVRELGAIVLDYSKLNRLILRKKLSFMLNFKCICQSIQIRVGCTDYFKYSNTAHKPILQILLYLHFN